MSKLAFGQKGRSKQLGFYVQKKKKPEKKNTWMIERKRKESQ